jgi:serine/threonine protein kinase
MRTSSGTEGSLGVLPEDWPRTKALLTEAIKLTKADRQRFIAEACINEPQLRDELLSILASYDTAERVCEPAWTGGTTFGALVPSLALPVSKDVEPVLTPDATYGPYRVVKQLGAGGMGQVFLASDVRLHRRVAMKSLAGRWLESPTARQRLMREARSAAALTHPHIATLYDVLEDADHLLLVMEYVEGRPASALVEDGPIPLGHALRLAIQIAEAVSYAHDRGIIHCDIKPANVQVAVDGTAKVLDFGLARARYDLGDEVTISEQGKLLGTLGYMAPERIVEGTLNASGDIYSLGVVIFEMVSGRRFFDGTDLSAFLLTVLGSHVPKLSAAVSGVPPDLDEVVERALAKKPMLRYQSARELSRDLQRVLALVEDPTPRPLIAPSDLNVQPAPPARLYQRTLAAAAATTAVILTLAGFVTSTMYNSAFGITAGFQSESVLAWPYWGFRSLIAPMFYVGTALAVVVLLMGLCRLSLTLAPLRRWCEPISGMTGELMRRLRSSPTPALAQLLLIAHCAVIALNFWWFNNLMQGLDALIVQTTAGNLAPLAPGNRAEHFLYRQVLSLELGAFGAAWYALLKLRLEKHERPIDVGIAGGVALIALTLFLLVFPFRVLWHNEQERVVYGAQTCYFVAQRGNEGLLFCPMQDPPRNQVVRIDDRQLVRGGGEEDVFSRVKR